MSRSIILKLIKNGSLPPRCRVNSNSMSPLIMENDSVYIKPVSPNQIKLHDIITFLHPYKNLLISHRVQQLIRDDVDLYFKTKGDHNRQTDHYLVDSKHLVGLVTQIKRRQQVINLNHRFAFLRFQTHPIIGPFVLFLYRVIT